MDSSKKESFRESRFARKVDSFRGLHFRLAPDYTRPLLEVPAEKARRIRDRLAVLYGEDQAESVYHEVERIMQVHYAHATPEILEAEAQFDPANRFTEHDVALITYGDVIDSGERSPLRALEDFVEVFFHGIISIVHILPFFPYSSDRGFAVISYEEVDPHLGTWEEIAELSASFRLMFDGVFNHASSQNRWFQNFLDGDPDFEDFFISVDEPDRIPEEYKKLIARPRMTPFFSEFDTLRGSRELWTTFSRDQVDLNFKNPRVLLKILNVLLQYVRRGADIVRLDAIAYLWHQLGTSCKNLEQTHELVKLLRDVLDVAAPHVAIITESNVPHAENVVYFGKGTDEAQLIYNFALPPLVLHTFQTGNAEALSLWAASLEPPSETTAFFNFLDSHDGIGLMGARGILGEDQIQSMCEHAETGGGFVSMKDNGDGTKSPYELNITWFDALNPTEGDLTLGTPIDRFIASRAIGLVLKGVPAIYLPSIFGTRNDLEAVFVEGVKRSINRGKIHEKSLFDALANPDSIPARTGKRLISLLEKRVQEEAFHPGGQQQVLAVDSRVFALLRRAPHQGASLLAMVNVSDESVRVEVPVEAMGWAQGDVLRELVLEETCRVDGVPWLFTLEPYQVVWLQTIPDATQYNPL